VTISYGHVPSSPVAPVASGRATAPGALDVADVFRDSTPSAQRPDLGEKLRRAYYWMVNEAVISPHYDVEFEAPGPVADTSVELGETGARLHLPSGPSYSSFVLMPLLTFAVRGRCLFVGGPGRGKTTSAVLMGVIAGYPLEQVRRAMQHGHPQLTVSDLFGTPLPRDLVNADSLAEIEVSWRSWLGMRVKIIDEYNRIPTRTQSALLTVLADGYVESYDQVLTTGDAAWYLTANDDLGGGTYEVVEALRDRIDVTVQALGFNSRFLPGLLARSERGTHPERHVPPAVVFSDAEHEELSAQVQAVPIEPGTLRRLAFFASQLEVCERAATQFEYRTKDTARLAGGDVADLAARTTGRDHLTDIGDQTLSGLSVRAMHTALTYSKAMAYFRGRPSVGLCRAALRPAGQAPTQPRQPRLLHRRGHPAALGPHRLAARPVRPGLPRLRRHPTGGQRPRGGHSGGAARRPGRRACHRGARPPGAHRARAAGAARPGQALRARLRGRHGPQVRPPALLRLPVVAGVVGEMTR